VFPQNKNNFILKNGIIECIGWQKSAATTTTHEV